MKRQIIDVETRAEYSAEIYEIDSGKTGIHIFPNKDKYENLYLEIIIPVSYDSLVSTKKLAIKDVQKMVNETFSIYNRHGGNKWRLSEAKYYFQYHDDKKKEKKEMASTKSLKEDLKKYQMLKAKLNELKKSETFDVEEYKKYLSQSQKLLKRLVKNNILNEKGDLK